MKKPIRWTEAHADVANERSFELAVAAARIEREVALVHALATASPEVRAQIDAARADHTRVIAKLATGRWMRSAETKPRERRKG